MAEQSPGMSDEGIMDYFKLLSQFPEIEVFTRYDDAKDTLIVKGVRKYKGRTFSETKWIPLGFIGRQRFPGVIFISYIKEIFTEINHSVNSTQY